MWSSGVISEACSCGASMNVPCTEDGRAAIAEWRQTHRHEFRE